MALLNTRLLALAAAGVAALGACGGGADGASTAARRTATQPAPAAQRPIIGIGEQGFAMFGNPLFTALGVHHVRLVVAYDALDSPDQRRQVDTWLSEARRTSSEPFITFGHSTADPGRLPSVAAFRAAFAAFHKRYPQVKVFAPWNEINHASQPTHDNPRRAAEYYNVVHADCDGCTVLAGDVLDQPDMISYLARYRRYLDGSPRVWGLHNYSDTNRFKDSGLRKLLDAVPGDVWLTETGGIVRFGRNFPRDEQRAARAVRYAISLARDHDRVARLYLYNWTGAAPGDRFDSGLIGPDGKPRPGYASLRAALRR